jgi:hypothetical protein
MCAFLKESKSIMSPCVLRKSFPSLFVILIKKRKGTVKNESEFFKKVSDSMILPWVFVESVVTEPGINITISLIRQIYNV